MSRTVLSRSAALRNLHRTQTLQPLLHLRAASDLSHLQTELTARKIPLVYDYLVPTPSHLLNVALADVLPTSQSGNPRILPTTTSALPLPPTHHLIYFPPAIPGRDLLPDGTDPLQSPGEPFVRRMWAGGSVRFNNSQSALQKLALDGARVACVESIADVAVKGKEGEEKIFVGIERRVGRCASEEEDEESIRLRLGEMAGENMADSAVVERRNIVFLRERSKEQAVKDMERARTKQMKPPTAEEGVKATFSHDLVTDPKLLFRYSALTYNAHAIHLDPEYCREIEGHRGLLVHGPLSFTLSMTALRMFLQERSQGREQIKSIEYRNLSPLYCGELLRVAGLEREQGKWDLWAETPEGGVALKGTVKTETLDKPVEFGDLKTFGY